MKKSLLSIIFVLSLCVGLLTTPALAENAEAEPVTYVEYSWDEETSTLSSETKTVTEYTEITESTTTWGVEDTTSWYVVKGNVTIDSRVTVKGDVHLILTDGCSLNTSGITVKSLKNSYVDYNHSLTIYGQSQGTGMLSALATGNYDAGIGGGYPGDNCGTVVIHGGVITAKSRADAPAAGIGGAGSGGGNSYDGGSGGTVTVYGGTVTAVGGYDDLPTYAAGAGIGGGGGNSHTVGKSGAGGTVKIYGGVVNATGGRASGSYYGSGIGGGGTRERPGGDGGDVTIAGGIVTATGYRNGIVSGIGRGYNGEEGSGTLNAANCILNGTVYGSFTLTEDYTIPAGKTFTVPEGASLTIPADVTMTVNGTLTNNGTITNNGNLTLHNKNSLTGGGTVAGSGIKLIQNITAERIIVPTNLVYDGTDQTVAARNAIRLSTSQETICGATFGYCTWDFDSISPAVVKDAGTYTVTYKNGDSTVTQTFTVAPKDITGAAVSVFDPLTYNGQDRTPAATVTVDGLTVTGSWSTVRNVTDQTIFTADGNFVGSTAPQVTGMQPRSVTAMVTAQDKYWDGSDAAMVTIGAETGVTGETLTISGVTATFDSSELGENKTVALNKTSMLIAYPNDKPENYIVTIPNTVTAGVKVIPLTISGVVMDAGSYTYGDTVGYDNTALTISQPGGTAAKPDDLVYTYTGTANDESAWNSTVAPTKAGSYTLTVSHRDTVHYSGLQSVNFTIARKPVEEPTQAAAVTYNSVEQTYAVESNDLYTVETVTKTDANEAGYDVTISLKDRNNYQWKTAGNINNLTHKFTINKASATVTAKNLSYHIGTALPDGSAPELGKHYTVDGLFGEDGIGTVTMKYQKDGEDVTPDSNKTGTYDVIITVDDINPNYVVSCVNGSLTYYYTPRYKPTVESTEGGDVTISTTSPSRGQIVTITPKPDEGMVVDTVVVTDSEGNEIEVTGNSDGTYSFKQPTGSVTIKVTFKPATCPSEVYSDLDVKLWYHEAVDYVLHKGLMNGVGNGKFNPHGTTSRAMIVTILWRLENEPVVNYLMQFEDVPAEAWYTEAVRWAASEKIVEGYSDNVFGSNDPITREQLAAILWRYAKYKGYDVSVGEDTNILSYEDAFSISEYAIPAMQWACGVGVMQGDGVKLTPKVDATRAQAAALFLRFGENVAEK